tara:strand:+ start:2852 stop:3619 length:768 start_codon:yes stop_codon:yes gene_type:complete
MPEGEGTYGNQVGRPKKEFIPTKDLGTELKKRNKAPEYMTNKRTFVIKRYKNGGYYKQFENGVVDSIKKPVAEKLIADKRAGKANTKHYTVEYVKMKGVKDPKPTLQGDRREKVVERIKKKTTRNPDANNKPPTRVKFKGKGKAGMLLGVLSALGIGASTSKKTDNKKAPTKKRTSVPPSKSEGSRNVKAQMDSKEAIQARMKKDKDSSPVDFKGNYPVYRKGSSMAKSFRKKYNEEKAKGSKTFTWQGRKYTTK